MDSTTLCAVGVVGITVIEVVALLKDVNGKAHTAALGALCIVVGFAFGRTLA